MGNKGILRAMAAQDKPVPPMVRNASQPEAIGQPIYHLGTSLNYTSRSQVAA
jgi:hypothetical protein